MRIARATALQVDEAAAALERAFAADPLIAYFFSTHPQGIGPSSRRFFSLLLRVRIALGMPALVLLDENRVLGVAMGYDTRRPEWPEPFAAEWNRFEAETPGFAERLHVYETVSRSHLPPLPHHYLGVLGVDPAAQGTGAGKALLEAYCRLAAEDPLSGGVYLETSSRASLEFYRRQGFVVRGEDDLGGTPLWCVFRPDAGWTPPLPSRGAAPPMRSIVEFVLEIDKLKGVTRKTRPLGLGRYENSAEHSWQLALFAIALAPHAAGPIDLDRVIRMLLVHDIGEIDTGDTMVYTEGGWEERKRDELAAVTRIFALLPARTPESSTSSPTESSGEAFLDLWREFESGATAEARFAQAVDRAMPVLLNLANRGQSWRENGISHMRVVARVAPPIRLGCPALWEYLEVRLEEERRNGWFEISPEF
jgi:putative hydrolases of HD superfamily